MVLSGRYTVGGTQPVTLYVGSSEKNVHLFYHVYSGNRMLVSDSFVLNEEIRPFDYTWRPEYGDGITVEALDL